MTVYVVGLDGADWSFLTSWMSEGSLPAFARLCTEGVAADLESTLPPITFPAWKCYSTGKTPGKLGVYEWFAFERAMNTISTNDSSDFRSREYWDVLSDRGSTVGVVNMPTTYPPNGSDGVLMIAGSPASEREEFTAPSELKSDLFEIIPEYRVKPDLVLGEASPDELIGEAMSLADQRFDAAEWLADEHQCELVHLTVFITDTVQHRLWHHPAQIRRLYERIDDRLSRLMQADGTDAVFLMSDHGFVEIDETFLVNQWLVNRGDLVLGEYSSRNILGRFGLTEERLKRWVGRLGLVNMAQAFVPAWLQRFVPSESGRVSIQDAPIDWAETKAFSLGRGPLYLNEPAFDSAENRAGYLDELTEALRRLETPAGDPVVEAVHMPAEIYTGDLERSPDAVVEYRTGVDAPEAIGGDIFGERLEWVSTHRRTGIFGAWGEDISTSERKHTVEIYDLAPTLLHYLGNPVPEDVDGEVIFDIFEGNPAERDLKVGPPTKIAAGGTSGDQRQVEETLRDLGYVE